MTVLPSSSRPVETCATPNEPPGFVTMTTLRLPVVITASLGTNSCGAAAGPVKSTSTHIPGARREPGFSSATRAVRVRVCGSTCGSTASTRPLNATPGQASVCATTAESATATDA